MCVLCNGKGVVIQEIMPPRSIPKQLSAVGLLPNQTPELLTHPNARAYLRPCDCVLKLGPKRRFFSEMVRAMDGVPITFN